jgi:signal transduction histidine kinase
MTETFELYHSFDAKLATNIGEQSVSSNIQAIIELIKNSYDADALNCKVHFYADGQTGNHIKMNKIVIEDNGFGMTIEDFKTKWMRVATNSKIENSTSPILERRVSGEKGMGRFSAQRLGNIVKIISTPEDYTGRTKTKYGYNTTELTINWNQYVPGKDFEKIGNKLKRLDKKLETSGIKIEITDLKDYWTTEDIDAVVTNAGSLISPLILKNSDITSFNIEIVPHGFTPERVKVESIIEKYAPWEINAQLIGSKANYQIFHKKPEDQVRIPVVDINKRAKGRNELPMGSKTCGNFKIKLLIYHETQSKWTPKSIQKFSGLGDQLVDNCGIKIFNDGIRVMPYGNKNNDWLSLDRRYLKRAGGKVRNRNVIGFVFFTRKNNPQIKETTTREGLVINDEFKFVKERFIIDILKEFENYRTEWENAEEANKPKKHPTAKAESAIAQLTDFTESLDIKKGDEAKIKKYAQEISKQVTEQDKENTTKVKKMDSSLELYRNLASLGISALAFHHEIRPAIGRISQRLNKVDEKWNTWEDEKKLEYITKAALDISTIIDLNEYVRTFASMFSGAKGTKTPDQEIKFTESVHDFAEGFGDILEEAGIEVETITGPGSFKNLYMNRASWQSILINLMSNSIKALGNVSRKKKFIKVLIEKTDTRLKIEVKDNGSGIQEANFERIFDPLWTSYRGVSNAGTGMGTTIVKEIVEDDLGGEVKVKSSKYEKEYPGKGETTIQLLIPLDKLKDNKP